MYPPQHTGPQEGVKSMRIHRSRRVKKASQAEGPAHNWDLSDLEEGHEKPTIMVGGVQKNFGKRTEWTGVLTKEEITFSVSGGACEEKRKRPRVRGERAS